MPTDYRTMPDETLARLVRENAPDAFAELSARYSRLLRNRAAQFEGPGTPEREDLLQEGLFGLYAAAITFEEGKGAAFRTYAGTCVYRRMVDAARRHGSRKNRILNESLSLDSAGAADLVSEAGPEELLEVREQARQLLNRLHTGLSPLERKALALVLSGCRREEVEARFGMSLKTYDNALYRLRNKLRGI